MCARRGLVILPMATRQLDHSSPYEASIAAVTAMLLDEKADLSELDPLRTDYGLAGRTGEKAV